MSSNERKQRPKLSRTEARRSWSTLFDTPRAEPETGGAEAASSEAPPALNDVIARSVQLGYQVVDDYLRQGARVARQLSGPTPAPQVLSDEFQELGARSARHLAEVTRIWFDAVRAATGSAANPAEAPPTSAAPAASDGAATTGPPARVRIEIRAHQATDVSLDLQPEAARRPLVAHALRAADAESPRIREVSFQPATAEAAALLRIVVPADQPPGVYSGLLVDEQTNRPMGMLSVEVGPPGEPPRP